MIGALVRQLRRDRGWSAQRLADECMLIGSPTLSRGTIAKIESGVRKNVTTGELVALAQALGVEPAELLATDRPATRSAGSGAGTLPRKRRPVTRQETHDLLTLLARVYEADLHRPLTDPWSSDLQVPTVASAYVPPHVRAATVDTSSRLSDEAWWSTQSVQGSAEDVLTAYLSSGNATGSPVMVLGQPGSGKSLFTSMLAARLPSQYAPIRVALRNVDADADLQTQIEQQLYASVGERISWLDFARAAGDAVPVLLLDGFDELVAATGMSQSSYLEMLKVFQQRSAQMGQPVIIILTSRTIGVDRLRLPVGTFVLRLEPFDESQIRVWLESWNAANAERFAALGLPPLAASDVLDHGELATQPLLLLMLTMYILQNGPLQSPTRAAVYDQLLTYFAYREADKWLVSPSERVHVAEDTTMRLSFAAFAMLNRRSQQVDEDDLDSDLALLTSRQEQLGRGFRTPLRPAEVLLGEFFFVHQSRATTSRSISSRIEFQHATFAEFLIARFVSRLMREMVDFEAQARLSLYSAPPLDDSLLHALLSFAVLNEPILSFVRDITVSLAPDERTAISELLVRLHRHALNSRSQDRYSDYQPRRLPVPARHAIYSANLILLLAGVSHDVRASELFEPGREPVAAWHRHALLWRSQLADAEWATLVDILSLERMWPERDIRLALSVGDRPGFSEVDLRWTAEQRVPLGQVNREAYFQSSFAEDFPQHLLEPLIKTFGNSSRVFTPTQEEPSTSAARMLLDAWLASVLDVSPGQRLHLYRRCAKAANTEGETWDTTTRKRYITLLRDLLRADKSVSPETIVQFTKNFDCDIDSSG